MGVFDSRAVAMAWGRSRTFDKELEELRAEYDQAKSKGDTKRVDELGKMGPMLQERLHLQVFGNEPIDDVLERIEKDLPKIARAAGVDVIVSKWEIVYPKRPVEFQDVTWEMVNLFEPDAETRKGIKDILKAKPVSAKELARHQH